MYLIRDEFCKSGKWIRYEELDKLLKSDSDYQDYLTRIGNHSSHLSKIGRIIKINT